MSFSLVLFHARGLVWLFWLYYWLDHVSSMFCFMFVFYLDASHVWVGSFGSANTTSCNSLYLAGAREPRSKLYISIYQQDILPCFPTLSWSYYLFTIYFRSSLPYTQSIYGWYYSTIASAAWQWVTSSQMHVLLVLVIPNARHGHILTQLIVARSPLRHFIQWRTSTHWQGLPRLPEQNIAIPWSTTCFTPDRLVSSHIQFIGHRTFILSHLFSSPQSFSKPQACPYRPVQVVQDLTLSHHYLTSVNNPPTGSSVYFQVRLSASPLAANHLLDQLRDYRMAGLSSGSASATCKRIFSGVARATIRMVADLGAFHTILAFRRTRGRKGGRPRMGRKRVWALCLCIRHKSLAYLWTRGGKSIAMVSGWLVQQGANCLNLVIDSFAILCPMIFPMLES
jgi:hypothetical protein